MNNEARNFIYDVINAIHTHQKAINQDGGDAYAMGIKLQHALRDGEKYNGWVNFETWNMHLILSNEQNLSNDIEAFLKTELAEYNTEDKPFSSLTNEAKKDILYDIADNLKEYIEDNFKMEAPHESVLHVDCEYWTYRDFQEINWIEIVKAFLEETLKEVGFED